MANIAFDEIICSSILFYMPPKEWSICKPFLISSTFSLVFGSEEFAKQYLINSFKLSSEQVLQLEAACNLFDSSSISNNTHKKKKRKMNDEKIDSVMINRVAKSLKDVLNIYFAMSYEFDFETVKMSVIENLQFKKGVLDALEQAHEDLTNLQMESYLLKSFNYFTSEEPQRIMTRSKDFIISEKILLRIFGNVQDLFLTSFDEAVHATEITLCLFTSFGFPLFFKSEYCKMSHGLIKEKLDVFGKHVFMHELSHGDAVDKYDKQMLAILQKVLFPTNIDELLVKDAKIPEKDLSDVKLALLYEFLQCCFGKNGTMFSRFSLGWIPFVGKVRSIVREVGSTDFGFSSSDEEDSENDEDYEENEEENDEENIDDFNDSDEE